MLSEELRSYYLSSMGITQWFLRSLPLKIFLIEKPDSCKFVVAELIESDISAQDQLWQKITAALAETGGIQIQATADEFDSLCQRSGTIISLGQSADYLSSQPTVHVTHSLYDMILRPNLKSEVWRVFKNKILS